MIYVDTVGVLETDSNCVQRHETAGNRTKRRWRLGTFAG
jgi:hypothetical protein